MAPSLSTVNGIRGLAMSASPAPAPGAVSGPASNLEQIQPERVELMNDAVQGALVG
jgi:hypothetical protein